MSEEASNIPFEEIVSEKNDKENSIKHRSHLQKAASSSPTNAFHNLYRILKIKCLNLLPLKYNWSEEPIYLLNKSYLSSSQDEFLHHFQSKVLFTYRYDFPPIDTSSNITSDAGWGCMTRVMQMALCQCLIKLIVLKSIDPIEKDNNYHFDHLYSTHRNKLTSILKLFYDHPKSFLSIHNIVKTAYELFHISPGRWLGPTTVVQCVEHMTRSSPHWCFPVKIICFPEGILYKDQIDQLFDQPSNTSAVTSSSVQLSSSNCTLPKKSLQLPFLTASSSDTANTNVLQPNDDRLPVKDNSQNINFHQIAHKDCAEGTKEMGESQEGETLREKGKRLQKKHEIVEGGRKNTAENPRVIIFICTRLGLNYFPENEYKETILSLFSLSSFQGILGGCFTTSAYYFVAANSQYLYYLDPHVKTQKAFLNIAEELKSTKYIQPVGAVIKTKKSKAEEIEGEEEDGNKKKVQQRTQEMKQGKNTSMKGEKREGAPPGLEKPRLEGGINVREGYTTHEVPILSGSNSTVPSTDDLPVIERKISRERGSCGEKEEENNREIENHTIQRNELSMHKERQQTEIERTQSLDCVEGSTVQNDLGDSYSPSLADDTGSRNGYLISNSSLHMAAPYILPWKDLNPSMSFAFAIQSREEWDELFQLLNEKYSNIFEVMTTCPAYNIEELEKEIESF